MQESESKFNVTVIWRGNKYVVGMDPAASLKELGDELQKLSDVKSDTMRLIVPQLSSKGPRMLYPFSEEHSDLTLQEASINEGRSIRMMGVPEVEVGSLIKDAKANLRIAGFDEEERRLRHHISDGPRASLKLPQGPYIFCDFRTLLLPGIELHPPASEALKRMHMLAADPGIVAIMNKHRWRVEIMTEMAPIGYVGVSPKCILGLNKNHGEEISLRLRTDDLKGFRKYESIKKTLLHELAHMVHSEHDENFHALDRQLNKEAFSLDWTKSRAYKLSGVRKTEHLEEDFFVGDGGSPIQKLGGDRLNQLENARVSSVAAAYLRLASGSASTIGASEVNEEPDPDDSHYKMRVETCGIDSSTTSEEPDPDDPEVLPLAANAAMPQMMEIADSQIQSCQTVDEPDPDDEEVKQRNKVSIETTDFIIDQPVTTKVVEDQACLSSAHNKPKFDESRRNEIRAEPDPDDGLIPQLGISGTQSDEPDPDDRELQNIQDSLDSIFKRLQKAIEMLCAEVNPSEASAVLQTLFKIIRNIIEHPTEVKFKKLRKGNPIIRRHIASYKAAMEILLLIGFTEDIVMDEIGKAEPYLVLKRNDPGLLWLAKSSLETCIAF